jgi:AcrR family transcriptional regulator
VSSTKKTKTYPAKPATKAPKKRDREASCQKLLQAGLDVFSRWGFDGATTKMIAEKAGISEALIMRYFGGKEGLLLEVVVCQVAQMKSDQSCYGEGATLFEEIRNFMHCHFERDLVMKDFIKLVITRASVDPKFSKKLRETIPVHSDQTLMNRLTKLKQKKLIAASIRVEDVYDTLASQGFAVFYMSHLLMGQSKADCLAQLTHFAEVYAAGLSPQNKSK